MRLLIENYLSIFLVTVCALLCTSFIKSEIEINNARDFHSYCIAVIEASDLDKEAIDKCKLEATKRGYELNVSKTAFEKLKCEKCGTVFSSEGMDVVKCPNADCQNSNTRLMYTYLTNRICTVELKYKINLNLLNISKEGVINGYAR